MRCTALLALFGLIACTDDTISLIDPPKPQRPDVTVEPPPPRPDVPTPVFDEPAGEGPFVQLLSTQCALTRDGAPVCWDPAHPVAELRAAGRLDDLPPVRDLFGFTEAQCFVLEPSGLRCLARDPTSDTHRAFAADVEAVFGDRPVIAAESDSTTTCVLVRGEGPWCWRNQSPIERLSRLSPEQFYLVEGASTVENLVAGTHRFAGLDTEGHAIFWGIDGGTFGNGAETPGADHQHAHVGAQGMRFRSLDVYNETCGVDLDGALWCWGHDQSRTPQRIATPPGESFVEVKKSVDVSAVVARSGRVYLWGDTLASQLGTGEGGLSTQLEPSVDMRPADSAVRFVQVVAEDSAPALAFNIACGLSARGHLYCWGRPHELTWWAPSLRRVVDEAVPVAFTGRVAELAVGRSASCLLDVEGAVWCWGSVVHEALLPTSERLFVGTPTRREGLPPFERISLEGGLCGLSGSTWSCDSAVGVPQPAPPPIPGGAFDGIVSDGLTSCGLDPEGRLYCWGAEIPHVEPGQVRRDAPVTWRTPTPVAANTRWKQVVVRRRQVCGITRRAEVLCVGEAATSPLNRSDRADGLVAVDLAGEVPATLEEVGDLTCVRGGSPNVRCFSTARYLPLRPSFLLEAPVPITTLALMSRRVCASGPELGRWWCAPARAAVEGIEVLSLSEPMITPALRGIQLGDSFGCGFDAAGTLACFGDDDGGRLGRGIPAEHARPTLAVGWNAAGE